MFGREWRVEMRTVFVERRRINRDRGRRLGYRSVLSFDW